MAIALIKLITGEDIIGDVTAQSESYVSVRLPLRAHTAMQGNVPSVQLVRYMLLGDLEDNVDINSEHILAITTPMKKALDYYNNIADNMDEGTRSVEKAMDGTHPGYSEDDDISVDELVDLLAGKVTIQ